MTIFQSDDDTEKDISPFLVQYKPPSIEVIDVAKIPLPGDGSSHGTVKSVCHSHSVGTLPASTGIFQLQNLRY